MKKINVGDWYRTCQECGFEQADKQPSLTKEITAAYANRKCKSCHSEALDYGTFKTDDQDWTK